MAEKKTPAAIGLSFAKAPPASIDAGAMLSFSVADSWPEGFAKTGATYRVRDGEKTIYEGDLPKPEDDGGIPFAFSAPEETGEHRWAFTVASAANLKGDRAEGSLPLSFKTIPHATSLAVWDIQSPIVRGAAFEIKCGAKCTAACGLAGKRIEVRDETGKLMGSATLGNQTVAETKGLYWTSVKLKAPKRLKLHEWTAGFAPEGLKLAHGGSAARFTFVVVPEPAHSVSVKVVDKKTKAPIAGAQVRIGLYRAVTGDKGSVRLGVPKGEFPLIVTRAGYEMPERVLQISKDLRVQVGAEKLPEEDPFAAWTA